MNMQTLIDEGNMSGSQNTALTAPDVQNILNIMSRVELKGNEANTYVNCEIKLRMLMEQLASAKVPAKLTAEAGDGSADTTN